MANHKAPFVLGPIHAKTSVTRYAYLALRFEAPLGSTSGNPLAAQEVGKHMTACSTSGSRGLGLCIVRRHKLFKPDQTQASTPLSKHYIYVVHGNSCQGPMGGYSKDHSPCTAVVPANYETGCPVSQTPAKGGQVPKASFAFACLERALSSPPEHYEQLQIVLYYLSRLCTPPQCLDG